MSQAANVTAKTDKPDPSNDFQSSQFKMTRIISVIFNVVIILAQIKLLKDHDATIKTYTVFLLCNFSVLFSFFAPRLTQFTPKQVLKYAYMPAIISVFLFISQVTS